MQKKFVLGILVLIIMFSCILGAFSNFGVADQDYRDESKHILESTQAEAKPTKNEPTEAEAAPETKSTEAVSTEPKTTPETEHETNKENPAPEPEPNPESTEPEPTKTDATSPTLPVQKNYSTPILNAINFFKTSTEPEAMLWLDVIHRRFGITEFTNALKQFNQMLYWFPDKSYARLFRRMADYNTGINAEELNRITNKLDLITLPALYCDRLEFPADYSMRLQEGVNNGGYKLTHVLLAWIWIQENGGELELPDGFIEDMYHANAALINTDSTVTDVEMEAAAFLCLAGQSELIEESFFDCVIADQAIDGSWGGTTGRWHTTVLGLLFLLHMEFPSDSYPPVLAPSTA